MVKQAGSEFGFFRACLEFLGHFSLKILMFVLSPLLHGLVLLPVGLADRRLDGLEGEVEVALGDAAGRTGASLGIAAPFPDFKKMGLQFRFHSI